MLKLPPWFSGISFGDRAEPFGWSALIHVAVVTVLLLVDAIHYDLERESRRVHENDELRKHTTLIWYGAKMPEIAPAPAPVRTPNRRKGPNRRTVRTFDSNKAVPQIVWKPKPLPEAPKVVQSPDLAVISQVQQETPIAPPPPPKPVRIFQAPKRPTATPAPAAVAILDAPALAANAAPKLTASNLPGAAAPALQPPPSPTVASSVPPGPPKQAGSVTTVVAGNHPTDALKEPVVGSRAGIVTEGGGDIVTQPGGGPGLVVPGVMVESGRKPEDAAPSKAPSVAAAPPPTFRRPGMAAPLRPSSRSIPAAIESHFRNRVVYTLLLDRGSPRYARDWVIWFAEQKASNDAPYMRPPAPWVRTEPALSKTDNPAGTLYLAAAIGTDGQVESIAALMGSNPQWSKVFADSLRQWRFLPALRAQTPVTVDVVIEIPFAPVR